SPAQAELTHDARRLSRRRSRLLKDALVQRVGGGGLDGSGRGRRTELDDEGQARDAGSLAQRARDVVALGGDVRIGVVRDGDDELPADARVVARAAPPRRAAVRSRLAQFPEAKMMALGEGADDLRPVR